ncbi:MULTISPECIES: ABC transporter permease [Roseovarius]|uniref:ABC transporter, permease protein n=1 Tax=Roseovarius nubinhibens (strain ATCC BAA-591 / DSM 15170 / ISM) TaxID=89187 RepID=A3SL00_ROSNI|nr:ABC transporter permease [Roseovarius nubinhibens]EAP78031.1 ABC transporter, permease protein [Roseovarius nubinhibens ISM]
MFQQVKPKSRLQSAISILELIYHSVVRDVRKGHGNALMALAINLFQAILFVAAFYLMFSLLGLRGAALRGDFLLYIMSGIFVFLTHTKTLGAVAGAEGPSSAMMKHAPMNTVIAITSAAIGALYIQVLTLFLVLFVYHVGFTPFEIEQPFKAFGMFLLAWLSGVAIGVVLYAIKPWFPGFVGVFTTVYQRANMIASGKMFVANTLPAYMLAMFDWNPLFHCIDQMRGFVFVNYLPRNSSIEYPLYVTIVLMMIGLLGEFYTRQQASISWDARR